jgi:hypothetical protein
MFISADRTTFFISGSLIFSKGIGIVHFTSLEALFGKIHKRVNRFKNNVACFFIFPILLIQSAESFAQDIKPVSISEAITHPLDLGLEIVKPVFVGNNVPSFPTSVLCVGAGNFRTPSLYEYPEGKSPDLFLSASIVKIVIIEPTAPPPIAVIKRAM